MLTGPAYEGFKQAWQPWASSWSAIHRSSRCFEPEPKTSGSRWCRTDLCPTRSRIVRPLAPQKHRPVETRSWTTSSAVRAFEDLRGEVSLLRRAIEGLAAERRDQPDNRPTLEALAASNEELGAWARRISERPALQLTPQRIGEEIEAVALRFRQQDRKERAAAQARLASGVDELKAISRQARTTYEQVRREKIVGGVCFLGGLLLGSFLSQITQIWR